MTDSPLDFMQFRIDYAQRSLSESDVSPDPFQQFRIWFDQAIAAKAHEPNAMTLATATPDGQPSARIVLLKDLTPEGFSFFTNYQSHKGRELAANPRAALVFYWPELERQVRMEGTVSQTTAQESDDYFSRGPLLSRIGSAASSQSQIVPDRAALESRFQTLQQQHPDNQIPRPPHWGGYRVSPTRFEFWQGRRSRLHDRIEYTKSSPHWLIRRLAP